jgi:hypothetical protein
LKERPATLKSELPRCGGAPAQLDRSRTRPPLRPPVNNRKNTGKRYFVTSAQIVVQLPQGYRGRASPRLRNATAKS